MLMGKSLAVLTTALLACAVIAAPVAAQYSGQSYGGNPNDGAQIQYDQQRQQYDQQRQQYEQERQQYDRTYGADRGASQYGGPQGQIDQREQYNRDQAAQQRRENYDHAYSADQDAYYRDCQQQRASNQTGGLIIGAIAGGLLGSTVARGPSRGAGTIIGAIAGGAVGAGVGGAMSCGDRGYVNRTYYSGFEAGRRNTDYRWRNAETGNYGTLRVNDYYQDRDDFRCARYTQTIWINGRPVPSSGHACRQRDGNWAIVD
jgi:surface antigen